MAGIYKLSQSKNLWKRGRPEVNVWAVMHPKTKGGDSSQGLKPARQPFLQNRWAPIIVIVTILALLFAVAWIEFATQPEDKTDYFQKPTVVDPGAGAWSR